MARILVFTLVCASVLVLQVTPSTAARTLRGTGRSLLEENSKSEQSSSYWSDKQSGHDAVPTPAAEVVDSNHVYNEWVRFQEEQVTADYGPAAANPSFVCCTPPPL